MNLKAAILQELEIIKEGFNDAEKIDGYDLANERFHLKKAISLVKKLTIPVVGCQREQLKTTKEPLPYDEWKKHLKIQKPNNQIYKIGDDYITLNEVLEMYEDYYHSF